MSENQLKNILTQKECYQIIKKYSYGNFDTIENYHIVKADENIKGFMGDHFRLRIEYTKDGLKHSTTFFVKSLPIANDSLRTYVEDLNIFTKECFMYKDILSKLSKYTDMSISPKCYLVNNGCMVLEDLTERDFKTLANYRQNYFNLNELLSLVKTLAQFHSASIILEEIEGVSIKKTYKNELKQVNFSNDENHPRYKVAKSSSQAIIDYLKTLKDYDAEVAEKLRYIWCNEMAEYSEPCEKFRNVIVNADLWANNIMMNANLECILVDFQFARIGPPAFELLMTLYLNASSDMLQNNMNYFIDVYYKNFANNLSKYNLNADEVFNKNDFLDSLEYFKIPALIEAIYNGQIIWISEETTNYIMKNEEIYEEYIFNNRSKFILPEFHNNKIFNKKMNGLLNFLIPCLTN